MPTQRCLTITAAVVAVVGAVLIILSGVLFWAVVPGIIEKMVKKEMRIEEGSFVYEKWVDIPIPFHFKVWFFNVTNYDEIMESGDWTIQPIFEEVGPYVWTENRTKHDITHLPNDRISFNQTISYHWSVEESGEGLSEFDHLTLINAPLIAAVTLLDIYDVRILAPAAFQSLLSAGETIVMPRVTPNAMVFTGVQLKPVYKSIEMVAELVGIPLPNEFDDAHFAVFRGKNGTSQDGVWVVNKGVEDYKKFNVIHSVGSGKTDLKPWWDGPCSMINGTDGIMFPPLIEKEDRLYMYSPEISRSVAMDYYGESEYGGIDAWRFSMFNDVFSSPDIYPPNWCFCPTPLPPLNDSCSFSGVGRVFSTKENVPIVISKPHFLDASEEILAKGRKWGLSPRRELHDAYVDVQPLAGFPLRGHKRLQINVEVQPYGSFEMKPFSNMPHEIYPILWVDETAEMDDHLLDDVKKKVVTPLKIVNALKWTLIGVGAFMLIAGVLYIGYTRSTDKKRTV